MKLRPLQDRVIVKQTEAEEKTKSGIYLPDAAKERPTRGKVVSVGPGHPTRLSRYPITPMNTISATINTIASTSFRDGLL